MSRMPEQDPPQLTYDLGLLDGSAAKWRRSAGLRAVYHSMFADVRRRLADGPSLELGSGIGNLKECIPGVVTSDLVRTPYVDLACSAYSIGSVPPPAGADAWANIIAIDVLHHLCRPIDFFRSAAGALRPGGRIVLLEPAATPFGRLFYSLFHAEPIAPGRIQPPFELPPDSPDGGFANMGMGVALFRRHLADCRKQLDACGLELVEVSFRDLLAYPLSGGYSGPQLAPAWLLRPLLRAERLLPQAVLRLAALRMVIVAGRPEGPRVPQCP